MAHRKDGLLEGVHGENLREARIAQRRRTQYGG